MGYRNVHAVFEQWGHLPHRSFRLLAYMALISKDGVDPLFFGGRESLIKAMGYSGDSANKSIKETLRELKTSGAVAIAKAGHKGVATEYLLRISWDAHSTPQCEADGMPTAPPNVSLKGGASAAQRGVQMTSIGDAHSTPPTNNTREVHKKEIVELRTEVQSEPALTRSPKGSRLSDDWKPSKELAQWTRNEFPNASNQELINVHKTFVDYWISQPGQKGVKANWDATWRNWLRREFGEPRRNQRSRQQHNTHSLDQKFQAIDANFQTLIDISDQPKQIGEAA